MRLLYKALACFVVLGISAGFGAVAAQTVVVGPLKQSAKTIDFYEKADAATTAIAISVGEIELPLKVIEASNSMHRVELKGKTYWVKGMDVRISRIVEANCAAVVNTPSSIIGTPGAGARNCK
jgi:hypothetical protein